MAEFRLSPRAQRDLEAIFDHTAAEWGVPQAVAYVDQIEQACTDLANAPLQSSDCSHIRAGYRRRALGRHVLYFRPTDYGVAVMRILHDRMDAPRHI
ncbi:MULTISPECIES: type II toxin-antitoxin system RelE/ParE family toxin [Novosphingobium]|jgi:toxin ParE1/3/4|uniref:type II toxin-antitoxin system RelE/ParE family toxin n=1 Tax=Novosphingobium TaxID=165696 RepID=UPI0022F25249|nr:type II toxin-antitoxin system RelE/ParE family toxin [Novosphingobium resinovorum]GLK45027.1 toxin ParE1 [Novosphingobium resinovorum]